MAPNIGEINTMDPKSNIVFEEKEINTTDIKVNNYSLTVLQSSMNIVAHLLMSATVGITVFFAAARLEFSATQIHIIITTIGVSKFSI